MGVVPGPDGQGPSVCGPLLTNGEPPAGAGHAGGQRLGKDGGRREEGQGGLPPGPAPGPCVYSCLRPNREVSRQSKSGATSPSSPGTSDRSLKPRGYLATGGAGVQGGWTPARAPPYVMERGHAVRVG